MKPTDPGQFLTDLNAGVFAQQIGTALSNVAGAVVDHDKTGSVVITLNFKRIGTSHQVAVTHKLQYTEPTRRGKRSEETALETPMHVTASGLQLFAEDPTAQLFTRDDAPVAARD